MRAARSARMLKGRGTPAFAPVILLDRVIAILSENIIGAMSSKPGCGDDVSRDVSEKHINGCLNLLRCESLWEKVQRDNECRVVTPVREMKCNLVAAED